MAGEIVGTAAEHAGLVEGRVAGSPPASSPSWCRSRLLERASPGSRGPQGPPRAFDVSVDGAEPIAGTWVATSLGGGSPSTGVVPGTISDSTLRLVLSNVPPGGLTEAAVWITLELQAVVPATVLVTLERPGDVPAEVSTILELRDAADLPPTGGIALRGLFDGCPGDQCEDELVLAFEILEGEAAGVSWTAAGYAEGIGRPATNPAFVLSVGP